MTPWDGDPSVPAQLAVLDSDTTVRWVALDALRGGDPPLYPVGMAEVASGLGAES